MNDSTHLSQASTLEQALGLGALGYKIVPIPVGEKFPKGIPAWQEKATNDELQIQNWWGQGERGIGWAMGRQPNGMNVVAVDVDVNDGKPGKANIAAFIKEHGLQDHFAATVTSRTGSGGYHFIFGLPDDVEITNGKLLEGVDIRGEGGFIVIPPSIHPNGEPYSWKEGKSPFDMRPALAPDSLVEALQAPVPVPTTTPTPQRLSAPGDVGPIEWANRNLDPNAILSAGGWQYSHAKGGDQYWARPGKSLRDGHSAVVHDDGTVVIWTTELPAGWSQLGKAGRDGSVILTPFDVFCAVEHGCDVRSAMRVLRLDHMPREAGPLASIPSEPASTVQGGVEAGVSPTPTSNLPDEFWESREWLAHIRTAAHSRMASADAILGAVFARYSATIPVTYRIPPIVMAASTFDHMSVLVSESSGGKSGAAHIAKELLPPVHEKVIRWDQPVGSGEGLVELFYDWVMEENDKGKQVEVHKKVFNAVHFTADEGMALVQTSRRDSTTIGSILCSAWTGTQLGQANASRDRKRIVEAGTGRVAGVMGIQLSLGHHLLADEWVRQGLSGRLVFFAAEDPTIPAPADMPDWPGPLDVRFHPITPTELVYDQTIVDEIRHDHWTRTTGQRHEAPIDGHTRLAKLKISGMIALIEGRQTVTVSDWELAGQILNSSTKLRNLMLTVKQIQDRDASHTRAVATAETELIKESHKERKAIAHLCDTIIAKVPEEGIAVGKLRKSVTATKTRHRFETALGQAVERGAVAVDNGVVFPA